MAYVFNPNTTVIREVTKDGEITVNLVLTIKIEGTPSEPSASVMPSTTPSSPALPAKRVDEDDDKVDFMLPDIKTEGLIKFGKKE